VVIQSLALLKRKKDGQTSHTANPNYARESSLSPAHTQTRRASLKTRATSLTFTSTAMRSRRSPPFLQRRNSLSKVPPRKAGHIHKQPWTVSIAPGKKENPFRSNVFHRCWVTDGGRQGRPYNEEDQSAPRRWTKERKTEYYEKYDAELNAKKPVDEHFAIGTNAKMWTHLNDHGVTRGGQEKLSPVPPRRTGLHAKHGLYIGKFENVQHAQIILRDPKKARAKLQGRLPRGVVLEDYQVDARLRFDNRLKDDMIRYNDEISREVAQISYDLYRPHHTRSCPQMGVDYMHR